MKRILITGGSGLVGNGIKSLHNDENNSNYDMIYLSSSECNLENYSDTLNIFKHYKPNYVIHLAAYVVVYLSLQI